jgi:hypothetical protein
MFVKKKTAQNNVFTSKLEKGFLVLHFPISSANADIVGPLVMIIFKICAMNQIQGDH